MSPRVLVADGLLLFGLTGALGCDWCSAFVGERCGCGES